MIAQRFYSHKCDQLEGESIADYDATLRKLAIATSAITWRTHFMTVLCVIFSMRQFNDGCSVSHLLMMEPACSILAKYSRCQLPWWMCERLLAPTIKVLSKVYHYTQQGWPASISEDLQHFKSRQDQIGLEDGCLK